MPWEVRKTFSMYIEEHEKRPGTRDVLQSLLADEWEPFAVDDKYVYLRKHIPPAAQTAKELEHTYAELRAI